MADVCSTRSLQVLHTLPEGGGEPVPPGDEGILRPAAGPDGGGWSRWAEDEGCGRRSRLPEAQFGSSRFLRLPFPSALTACSSVVSGLQPDQASSRRRVRSRWQLLYTLVNNPSLLGSRKHFQTLQTSESILNGTPNHGSKKEAAKAAAEAVEPAETPSPQEQSQADP